MKDIELVNAIVRVATVEVELGVPTETAGYALDVAEKYLTNREPALPAGQLEELLAEIKQAQGMVSVALEYC